jgi:hypothetical protein
MSFKVQPILGAYYDRTTTDEELLRTNEDVAHEMEEFYAHAAEQGGRVIAGHTVSSYTTSRLNHRSSVLSNVSKDVVYLVAELPDIPPTSEEPPAPAV